MNDQNILYVIADIAHGGGLVNMSAEDALTEIRHLTKAFWKRNRSPQAIKNDIMCGLMLEKAEYKPRKVKTTYGNNAMNNERNESDATAHPVDTLVTCAELKHICDTVVELTKVRAAGCSHLAIENFAPELMAKLLAELSKHKKE